jgi:Ca2+-binding EF-hand superfamily protein
MDNKSVPPEKLSRFANKEIERIRKTEGFQLFLEGKTEKINDTDFYTYLGVTPRTAKSDFIGRLNTVKEAVKELEEVENKSDFDLKTVNYYKFLVEGKFKNIVEYFEQ